MLAGDGLHFTFVKATVEGKVVLLIILGIIVAALLYWAFWEK